MPDDRRSYRPVGARRWAGRLSKAVAASLAACGLLAGSAAAEPRAGLVEEFEDWTVTCAEAGTAVICTMAQDVRTSAAEDRRILGARIDLENGDAPRLTLILPPGLDLHVPVTLAPAGEGEAPLAQTRPRVCLEGECYGFVALTAELRAALAPETALRVRLTPFAGDAREVPLSLRGFDAAFARLREFAAL